MKATRNPIPNEGSSHGCQYGLAIATRNGPYAGVDTPASRALTPIQSIFCARAIFVLPVTRSAVSTAPATVKTSAALSKVAESVESYTRCEHHTIRAPRQA